MTVVGMVVRAELRRRWRSWLALALLVAVVGGVVLGAAAAGRRTESAFPDYLARYGFDVALYTAGPLGSIAHAPGVAHAQEVIGLDNGQPTCACTQPLSTTNFGVITLPGGAAAPFSKLVAGRRPRAADEVLASYTLRSIGIHLGSVIRVPLYAASQTQAYDDATSVLPVPRGPTMAFTVVGFEATEWEFPSGQPTQDGVWTSPAFDRTVLPKVASGVVYLVRLRHGAAGLPAFDRLVTARGAEPDNEDASLSSVQSAIHPQALGWWLLAGLATVVGVAVVGQALFRQSSAEDEDVATLAALGMDRRHLVAAATVRNAAVGVVGAAGAVVVAFLLSPIAPLGEARVAEPDTGLVFDPTVLLLGALGVVVVVVGLGLWPAWRSWRALVAEQGRAPTRPSVIATRLAAAGAPPSMVVGVRSALERRSGGSTVPVGTALLGTVLAVVALVGTAVFGASLSHLTATPRLYGTSFGINFTTPTGSGPDPTLLAALRRDPTVTRITEGYEEELVVHGRGVAGLAGQTLRGPLLFSTVAGRLPDGDGQIAMGSVTLRQTGAHVGSVLPVTVTSPSGVRRTAAFTVVGEVAMPVLGGVALGNGAILTIGAYRHAACPPGPHQAACLTPDGPVPGGMLVGFSSGPAGRRAVAHYLRADANIAASPPVPTSLVNFGEAVNFPLLFGIVLAVSGAATLVHLLVVSVARRRREIGLLRAVGFVNAQVVSAFVWQATTLAALGIVVGVPLGIVVGQVVWTDFAGNLGVVPVSVLQAWLLAVVAAGVVVVAGVLALPPAAVATRLRTGELLRMQ